MKFKATVYVKLRGSVSDAAGNAVMNNTNRVAPELKSNLLRIGKCIDYWFEAEDYDTAEKQLYLLSDRMLANTVIEDWEYEFHETEETGIGNISNSNAGTSKHAIFDES
jgi:phosphoribosylformylglycinamidine synthase